MGDSISLDVMLSDEHPIPVMVVEGGVLTAVNAAMAALLGPAAAPGADVGSLFDRGSRHKLAAALAGETHSTLELEGAQPLDDPMTIRFLVAPAGDKRVLIGSKAGPHYTAQMEYRLLEMNSTLANLTRALSQRTAELAAAKVDLENLGALRDHFIATLSHDLRSPLTAIKLQAASLERRAGEIDQEDVARRSMTIQRNVDRILDILTNVLDAARLKAGRVELVSKPVSLAEVAADVADSVEPVATKAAVQLHVESAKTEGMVLGDRVRLFQVISNLVDNAIRHSPAGGVVRVELEEDGDRVRCAVRDEGHGVPPELRERIFQRFHQSSDRSGSSGLGLYIARQLVELHRGRLWVEGATPGGAVFVFELPRVSNP